MFKISKMLLLSFMLVLIGNGLSIAAFYDVEISSPIRITNTPATSIYPSITVDSNGQAYVAWAEASNLWLGWGQYLYYTKVNSSSSFQTPILLSSDVGQRIGEPAMTTDDGNIVHVLWHHNNYAAEEMYYRSIKPDGTIMPWTRMTYTNSWNTDVPRVKIDSSNGIHLTFSSEAPYTWQCNGTHFNLYYKKFRYYPATGGVSEIVSNKLTFDGGIMQVGDLDVDLNGNVHIVWQDDGGTVNYIKLDGNNGGILIPKIQVNSSSSYSPSIKVDHSDNVHIVWIKLGNVYYKKFDDNGNVLVNDTQVTNVSSADGPGIVVDSYNNPHIAWIDSGRGVNEISYVMLSGTDGSKLTGDTIVTDDDGFASNWVWPSIAIDYSNRVHIAWQDARNGNQEIYYRQISVKERNHPPLANAGTDQTVSCSGSNGTAVTLNGSGSSDPDGDALTYNWTWAGGNAEGVNPVITLPLGTTAVTLTVTDEHGASSQPDTVNITVQDSVPPSTSAAITGTSGNNGWYKSDVNVSLTSADNCSGVKEIHYILDGAETIISGSTAGFTISADGTHSLSFWAVDNANNPETAHPATINIDKTLPAITATISPTPNANGWNNTDVTVTFTCSDATSGIAVCPTPITVTTEGSGQEICGTAIDNAGNSTNTCVTLNIDKTAPVLDVTVTPGLLWPPNHKMVNITPLINVSDNQSANVQVELISVTSSEPDNGLGDGDTTNDMVVNADGTISLRAERSGTGTGRVYTITYKATDLAGNITVASATVVVPHDMGKK